MPISVANSTLCYPIALYPSSTFHSQRPRRFSKSISGNGTWVRQKRRLYVKSSSSETKADEASQKSTTISSDTSSNTSSSFLSFLCPLLKVFSVSPSLLRNFRFCLALVSWNFMVFVFLLSVSFYFSFVCLCYVLKMFTESDSFVVNSNISLLLFPGRWSFSTA